MNNWKKNDFERVEGEAIVRAVNKDKAKRERKTYIVNKKGREEGTME